MMSHARYQQSGETTGSGRVRRLLLASSQARLALTALPAVANSSPSRVASVSVAVIAAVLGVIALRLAQDFLVPLVLGLLIAYALDPFKRKIVGLAGSAPWRRVAVASTIDDINRSIEHFLLVVISMNVLVGLCTWAAFHALGLSNAGAWALLAGLLNTIPYVGSAAAAVVFFLAALLQFDTVTAAIVIAGVFIAITSVESMLATPWLLGRTVRMNNVAVFGGLLFWGWLWGPWGLALSLPMMVVLKTVADRVGPLRPVGEMLGR